MAVPPRARLFLFATWAEKQSALAGLFRHDVPEQKAEMQKTEEEEHKKTR